MIRHICMFKLKEENKEYNIQQFIEKAEPLKGLAMVKALEAVKNSPLAPSSNFDIALIVDFESINDLESYQKDPTHIEFGRFISDIREVRACIDYEM